MHRRSIHLALLGGAAAALALAIAPERPPARAQTTGTDDEEGCAIAADNPLVHSGDALDTITLTREGILFNPLAHNVTLMRNGGNHIETELGAGITDALTVGCAGDFNEDGYDDIIGSTAAGGVKIYLNQTSTVTAPDWNVANSVREPQFSAGITLDSSTSAKGLGWMACGDVDNDGFTDAVLMRCDALLADNCNGPDYHRIYYGNGTGGLRETRMLLKSANTGRLYRMGTRLALHDVSGDGRNDLIMGQVDNGGGRVVAVIATTNLDKRFDNVIELFDDVGYTQSGGVTSLAVADFTNDGRADIIVGNSGESLVKLFTGSGGTSFANTGITVASSAFPTALLAGNFALTGRKDMVVGSAGTASLLRLYENDGDSQPFSSGTVKTLHVHSTPMIFSTVLALEYDGDPDRALDIMSLDVPAWHHVFANRRNAGEYVDCGVFTSANITSSELEGKEAVVTQIRITPSPAEPSAGSWTWSGSNDGETWHEAIPCPDGSGDHCVELASSGSNIQWRVEMCSNEERSQAPTLNAVTTRFTYVSAANHFRAGPIARDGLIYVGAFREPGEDGRFMAIDDETTTVLWDAASKLDAASDDSRKIFGVADDGTLKQLTTANASSFVSRLIASDVTQASEIITWLRSKRFGTSVNNRHALGGIVNSTPALLSRPGLPYWYNLSSTPSTDKTAIAAHVTAYTNRPQLALVGARDGMVHAFRTNPFDRAAATNGTEAWAFVPPTVMDNLLADKTTDGVTAWPDGSPTLATAKINGAYRSVLVMGEGNGGTAVFALDVTETIGSTGTVVGPTLLWSFTDANMGLTRSKPVVIRTRISGVETWLAVFSSGKGASNDVGDSVYAVDISTGSLIWRFDIDDDETYVSSDITAADEEASAPDGYISRLYFADSKGRLWKLDPSTPSNGKVSAIGTMTLDEGIEDPDPTSERPLFSTRQTQGALGEDRGISGTLIAVPGSDNRLVLYFGTGGTPETATDAQNEFYAVYGDTGEVRTKMTPAPGVRFFGSATYNSGQIVFTRGEDVSSVDSCAPTSGEIVAIDAATFSEQFVMETNSTITAPMYAAGGEIFVLTLSGKVVASQYVGVRDSVTETGNGNGSGSGGELQDAYGEVATPFVLLSWKQVY